MYFLSIIFFNYKLLRSSVITIKNNVYRRRSRKKYKYSKIFISRLFSKNSAYFISQQERTRLKKQDYSLVYGEVTFDGFAELLAMTEPNSEEVFYDLGSGSGKAIFIAALLYPWRGLYGIELLPGLYELSIAYKKKVQAMVNQNNFYRHWPFNINIQNGDLFKQDITKANVVFVNATGFFGESLQQLFAKLSSLKSGSRIIITSKKLPTDNFKLIASEWIMMSWGKSYCSVYERINIDPP